MLGDAHLGAKLAVLGGLLFFGALLINQRITTSTTGAEPKCDTSDFWITGLRWRNHTDVHSIDLTGTLINGCVLAATPITRFLFIDAAGKPIGESGEVWLSGAAIAGNTPHQFSWSQHLIGEAAGIRYKIVQVRQ